MQFRRWNLHLRKSIRGEGAEECFYVGGALLPFALDFVFKRKPVNDRGSFIAPPAPSFDITSPNIRPRPPRCGREVTAPPTPKSKPGGVVSRMFLPRRRRPRGGRRSKNRRSSWRCARPRRPRRCVVPANAGTHNHRSLLEEKVVGHCAKRQAAAYGS